MKKFKIAMALICLASAEASLGEEVADEANAHKKDHHLCNLPQTDKGRLQSPINILTRESANVKPVETNRSGGARASSVENKGHTIQLNFAPGSVLVRGGRTYELAQCHFHTPSEHRVDGMVFPMEMHIVTLEKQKSKSDAKPAYLVVGLLFKMGQENPFIAEFLDRVPEKAHQTASLADREVLLEKLVPMGDAPTYFSYAGSLTTPPYTEAVSWVVLQKVLEASPEQIQRINELEGNNARQIQSLYGRKVKTR